MNSIEQNFWYRFDDFDVCDHSKSHDGMLGNHVEREGNQVDLRNVDLAGDLHSADLDCNDYDESQDVQK